MKFLRFEKKGFFTCNSKEVIYMLKCPCGMADLREKARLLKVRLNEHCSNIRLYRNKIEKEDLNKAPEIKKKYGESTVRHLFCI